MDATFIGLLQSQISSLQGSESTTGGNIIILETIKLLLENVDLSSDTLTKYDKFGMRRLFAAYGEVGKKVCAFYNDGKSYLDPAALDGSIGKTIAETSGQIVETTTAFDELAIKEDDLLAKEDELKAIETKYTALCAKTKELRALAETVSDSSISAVENENEQLEAEIAKGRKRKETVDEKNSTLRKVLSEVEKTNTEVDSEQRRIKSNITSIIDNHHDEIQALYSESNKSLDEIKSDIERYIRDFEALDSSVVEYTETKAFYETWLGENSSIIETMRRYGLESIAQLTDAINNAKASAEYELKAYDAIVKKIITAEETAREAIEKKQNRLI
ncbi:MAG: hypothetical protein IJO74_00490 [Clostridia bacterium]|nr:hypothetical protein [Clostridia bacterium]